MRKLLYISSLIAITTGFVLAAGGIWGIYFTYKNVSRENIITPPDASIPEQLVRGPWTLKAQADIIREHTLSATEGKTFAEMPRQIPKLDEKGNSILDVEEKPVMVPNAARDIWITATTLMTALNLAILSYAVSGFASLFGLAFIYIGIIFCVLLTRRNR